MKNKSYLIFHTEIQTFCSIIMKEIYCLTRRIRWVFFFINISYTNHINNMLIINIQRASYCSRSCAYSNTVSTISIPHERLLYWTLNPATDKSSLSVISQIVFPIFCFSIERKCFLIQYR